MAETEGYALVGVGAGRHMKEPQPHYFSLLKPPPTCLASMIDFKELPKDGTRLEQLVREILFFSGFEPHWTGEGPDQGRDLYFVESLEGPLSRSVRRWLVQCKHAAHSGKSIGRSGLGDIVSDCRQIGATGFLLVTTTHPSASLQTKLKEISSEKNGLDAIAVWDSIELEKRLLQPRTYALIHIFFPKSSSKMKWKIFNKGESNKWAAHFKDYFVLLHSRIAGSHPSLDDCEQIFARMEKVKFKDAKESLRPRAIFYDDKHSNYVVYVDYMVPHNSRPSIGKDELLKLLQDGRGLAIYDIGEGNQTYWDVRVNPYSGYSDHYHRDHYDYYADHMASYEAGMMRIPFWRRKDGKTIVLE